MSKPMRRHDASRLAFGETVRHSASWSHRIGTQRRMGIVFCAGRSQASLMPARLHDVSDDGVLAQLLARLQTMQPFHQYETFAVLPHQDRALQADLEDALGDLLSLLG